MIERLSENHFRVSWKEGSQIISRDVQGSLSDARKALIELPMKEERARLEKYEQELKLKK